MAKEYTQEPKLETFAQKVIEQWHGYLEDYTIAYLGVRGGWESRGKTVFAKIKKASGR